MKTDTTGWTRWSDRLYVKHIDRQPYEVRRLDGGNPEPWVVDYGSHAKTRLELPDGTTQFIRLNDAKRAAHAHAKKETP